MKAEAITGNSPDPYRITRDYMGNVTITRTTDGRSLFLQGDDAAQFNAMYEACNNDEAVMEEVRQYDDLFSTDD